MLYWAIRASRLKHAAADNLEKMEGQEILNLKSPDSASIQHYALGQRDTIPADGRVVLRSETADP